MEKKVVPPTKFRVVLGGSMGEGRVLQALLGPQTKVGEMTLSGYEIRRQSRPDENIWNVIKETWDDVGVPYQGAYTLAPKEGARATVGYAEFDSLEALKKAAGELGFWSFHTTAREINRDVDAPSTGEQIRDNSWFQFQKLNREGDIQYFTEMLNPHSKIPTEPVAENFRETEKYQRFIDDMVDNIHGYQRSKEGSSSGKEQG